MTTAPQKCPNTNVLLMVTDDIKDFGFGNILSRIDHVVNSLLLAFGNVSG